MELTNRRIDEPIEPIESTNRRDDESIEWTTRRIDESIQSTNRWNRQIDESIESNEAHLSIYCGETGDARQNPDIIRGYLSVSIL